MCKRHVNHVALLTCLEQVKSLARSNSLKGSVCPDTCTISISMGDVHLWAVQIKTKHLHQARRASLPSGTQTHELHALDWRKQEPIIDWGEE